MLHRPDGTPFTLSWATYAEDPEPTGPFCLDVSQKIYVRILIPELDLRFRALLDTGAPWVLLGSDLQRELNLARGGGERMSLSTRLGTREATLERITLTLLAEEGESLAVEATVAVCEWPEGLVVLGYQGFLQRIRFAVEPDLARFHFGRSRV